jgi:threonyl-tRNA synthetase
MIHRAIFGTLERFTGNLIEHFAGAFPVWLAPEQVRIIPIGETEAELAHGVFARFKAAGIRAHVDDRHETLNYRIREGEVQKVPYMAVIGQREAEAGTVALRVRGSGRKQEVIPVDDLIARVLDRSRTRALAP